VTLPGVFRPAVQAQRRIEHLTQLGFTQLVVPKERERLRLETLLREILGAN
jgi:predicted ATP-dependent serine protease